MAKLVAYSGSTPADLTLEAPQVGGDAPSDLIHRSVSEVVLTRGGVVVSARTRKNLFRWTFNYNAVSSTFVYALTSYFNARIFKYQPFGSSALEYTVRFVDQEFAPVMVSPGVYSLSFTLEEVDV